MKTLREAMNSIRQDLRWAPNENALVMEIDKDDIEALIRGIEAAAQLRMAACNLIRFYDAPGVFPVPKAVTEDRLLKALNDSILAKDCP